MTASAKDLIQENVTLPTLPQIVAKINALVDDPDPEVRLALVGRGQWRLDLRHHAGRWDKTPIVGDMDDMVAAAADMGRLDDFGPPGSWNQGDTSDPSH